jgi:hypothetical protein
MHKTYRCPCITSCPDLRDKECEVAEDYVNAFYAVYIEAYWGIEQANKTVPIKQASKQYDILQWQLANDCGTLCTESRL